MEKNRKTHVKSKYLFKRGGYAVALIALVLAAVIGINVLMSYLTKKVDLRYDLTADKKNSLSAENAEFVKEVEKEVKIYVLSASAGDYTGGQMQSFAQTYLGCSAESSDYYVQTTRLLQRYDDLGEHITVEYIDPYGPQMGDIVTKYGSNFAYGDIIVTCSFETKTGKKLDNHKIISFADIYVLEDTTGMAQMGMEYYYVTGSSLETSLTSAIATVTSEDVPKLAFLASHSKAAAFDYFKGVLELNNFVVEDISDTLVTNIPEDYDAVVICAPQKDFMKEELDALSVFLENDGKYGKTLLFYGDTAYQNLPNFYNFLGEWGIAVEPGIVFETNEKLHMPNNYSTYSMFGQSDAPFTVSREYVSGYNIPMYENGSSTKTTTTIIGSNGSSVIVPIDSDITVAPAEDLEMRKLSGAIISEVSTFDNEIDKTLYSYVIAFSSIDFISEEYMVGLSGIVDYKGTAINALRYATGLSEVSIIFDNKTIDQTFGLYVISNATAKNMRWIFVGIIPVAILVVAFVIFFRRRNK